MLSQVPYIRQVWVEYYDLCLLSKEKLSIYKLNRTKIERLTVNYFNLSAATSPLPDIARKLATPVIQDMARNLGLWYTKKKVCKTLRQQKKNGNVKSISIINWDARITWRWQN